MILIKGVQIVDGSGTAPYRADVILQGDKISAIGNFPKKSADVVIEGLGLHLTPGFIDVNTDSDHYLSLFTNPSQKDFLLQGVTTIIGGHCGSSLAPLLYGSLESVRKWTNINQINVDWQTFGEFLKIFNRIKLGVNFGTLIGHSTIRRALIGEDFRDLTKSELAVFKKIVQQSLEEGALGFSTGLGYAHSRQTPYGELKELVKIVKDYGGVYATHLRNEHKGLIASVSETLKLAKETGVKTLISHFRPLLGFEKDFEDSLDLIENFEGADLHFDSYPFNVSIVPIYTFLPHWAQNGGLDIMLANLDSEEIRAKILKELPKFGPEDIVVADTQLPDRFYLVGKMIGQIARNQGVSLNEALLRLMMMTRLRALVIYKNVNLELVVRALGYEQALVSSNAASFSENKQAIKHERFFKTFSRFLEIANQQGRPSLEEVIEKFTSIPAQKFGFKDRGLVQEGYIADLVLLQERKVQAVFVGGQMVIKDGKFQDIFAGRVLRRS